MKTTTLLVSALALAFTFGTAMAQTDTKAPAKQTTACSAECSQQADRQRADTARTARPSAPSARRTAAAKKRPRRKASKAKSTKAKAA